jgi:hypothetical protein
MPTVKLSALRQAAALLKTRASQADTNENGRLTLKELDRFAKAQGDGFATGKALRTLRDWALWERGGSRNVAVAELQARADDALLLLEQRDQNGNGTLDPGVELRSVRHLKTFDALFGLVGAEDPIEPKVSPFLDNDSFYELTQRCQQLSRNRYTDPAKVPAELHAAIIAAANESSYASTTLADVFAQVDQSEVVVSYLREPRSGEQLLLIDYGAGGNNYGAVFNPFSKRMLVAIADGDFYYQQ